MIQQIQEPYYFRVAIYDTDSGDLLFDSPIQATADQVRALFKLQPHEYPGDVLHVVGRLEASIEITAGQP